MKLLVAGFYICVVIFSPLKSFGSEERTAKGGVPLPSFDFTLKKQKMTLSDGTVVWGTSEVIVGTDHKDTTPSAITALLKEKLGISEGGAESFPIKKMIVVPKETDEGSIENLKTHITNVIPHSNNPVATVRIPKNSIHDWFVKNNNIVYSIIRFILNGSTIGAVLVYSLHVPVLNALTVGMLSGSMSGFFQYNIVAYKNWLQNGTLPRLFGVTVDFMDGPVKSGFKNFYNDLLSLSDQYGKYGLTEFVFIGIARLAMVLLRIPSVYSGIYANIANVAKTSVQSTFAQGVAVLGLFRDVEVQQHYQGWSDEFSEVFRNTSAFLISAATVAASALQLANPAAGGAIELGFFELPIGFAAIAVVGVGYYIHALFATWMGNHSLMSEFSN